MLQLAPQKPGYQSQLIWKDLCKSAVRWKLKLEINAESKEGTREASSTVTEDKGAPQEKGKVDQTQQSIVILTAFVAIFKTLGKEPYGSPGELKTC